MARTPLRRGEKLQEKIDAQLAAIKRLPQLVRSFFMAPSVCYGLSSIEPDDSGHEVDCGEKVLCGLVVAGGDGPELLETTEEILN